jgi:DNA helicase HerA-like ATPase
VTREKFELLFASKRGEKDNRLEGNHMMISGATGSGKTTLAENLAIDIAKRTNPWLVVFHSVKPGMDEEWAAFEQRCHQKGIKTKYVKFNEDLDAKVMVDLFPLSSLETIGRLSKTNMDDLYTIYNQSGQNTMSAINYIRDLVMNKKGGVKWQQRLISAIEHSPYLTYDRQHSFHFDQKTIYILDYSEIEEPHIRDFVIGSLYRLVERTVVRNLSYQAFHIVDEFYMMVLESESSKEPLKDAYSEIKKVAVSGRQQGISQILCYQTKCSSRKVTAPLLQCEYCFQLLPSGIPDREFFIESVIKKKISKYEFEEFFSNGSNIGKCIFFNTRTPENPKFVQLKP